MAMVLKATGEVSFIHGTKEDGSLSLDQMQKAVGGFIEIVQCHEVEGDSILVINEEGKLEGLPVNQRATNLADIFEGDVIVGDAIFCRDGEVT